MAFTNRFRLPKPEIILQLFRSYLEDFSHFKNEYREQIANTFCQFSEKFSDAGGTYKI